MDDSGHWLTTGEPRELCVRGPPVMKGYRNRQDESAKVFTAGGRLRTGDVAVIDERGSVKLVDRKKDMVLVSGFKVFRNEMEVLVAKRPGSWVWLPLACQTNILARCNQLVVRKDIALTADAWIAYCRKQLVT